jgi:hypothetical protein
MICHSAWGYPVAVDHSGSARSPWYFGLTPVAQDHSKMSGSPPVEVPPAAHGHSRAQIYCGACFYSSGLGLKVSC